MFSDPTDPNAIEKARRFVLEERGRCLSDREWRFRLAGYGYAIRDRAEGAMLTTLPGNVVLGPLYA